MITIQQLQIELAYVAGARNIFSRIYRCIRAAWRCAREANK